MAISENIPKILFKYRDWCSEYHRKSIYEQEVFLSSASKFNDPYEENIPYEFEKSELTDDEIFTKFYHFAKHDHPDWTDKEIYEFIFKKQQEGHLFDDNHKEYCMQDNRNSIERDWGIFCLTSNPNNFLMWSHYGNSHTGFCIGYDTEILFETLECTIGPVIYEEYVPKFKLTSEPIEEYAKKLLGTKGKFWEYEEEYRIIKYGAANKSFKLPKEAITEIIFGCKMDIKTKFSIIDSVRDLNINCNIHEMKQSFEKFELSIERAY
jgi:hypothetical protein